MKTMAAAMAVTGCMVAWPGYAEPVADEAVHQHPLRLPAPSYSSYSFPVSKNSAVFGYFGASGEPALGAPVSTMQRLSGIDSAGQEDVSYWLGSTRSGPAVFAVGYAWRDLKLEGSAFSGREHEWQKRTPNDTLLRLDSSSARLSYNPSPDWSFQFSSRGSLSGLDQLEPGEDIRRTTISATYDHEFSDGNWQTTLAWGRNVRKSREPIMGYLLESTLRLGGVHAIFGRLEQVGSDELMGENESTQRPVFKLNKFTVGYFHNVNTLGPLRFDAGIFASRHLLPSDAPSYGNDPTSYVLFIRFKLQ